MVTDLDWFLIGAATAMTFVVLSLYNWKRVQERWLRVLAKRLGYVKDPFHA